LAVSGGGIYCDNSSPVLQNVTISDNTSYPNYNPMWWVFYDSYGGGMSCVNGSNPALYNVTIAGNSSISGFTEYSQAYGGGIYCSGSSPDLHNVIITNNNAFGGIIVHYPTPGDVGGGIYCTGSFPTFKDVIITNNTAYTGGGIYCNGSSPVFDIINRSNMYFNHAIYGNDLYSDTYLEVALDTFTVLYPTDYYAKPLDIYSFDILNGKLGQVDADLYVSPDGDNSNTGLTPDDPLMNIHYAFPIIVADTTSYVCRIVHNCNIIHR